MTVPGDNSKADLPDCYTARMSDQPGQVATGGDETDFTLTIEQAAERYAGAGHPRTFRTLQRYCAAGHLDCRRKETPYGEKFLIAPYSVERHIAQIVELQVLPPHATSRDSSRPVVPGKSTPLFGDSGRQDATGRDVPPTFDSEKRLPPSGDDLRQGATDLDRATRHGGGANSEPATPAVYLEREVERLHGDIEFLRKQIDTKDGQITALLERDKETNFLIRGLQQMLSPLLGPPQGRPPQDGLAT